MITVEAIQQMSRKQLVNIGSVALKEIYADPDKRAAFDAVVNSPEGRAAVAEVVQQTAQLPEVPSEEIVVPEKTAEELAAEAEANRVAQEEADRKAAQDALAASEAAAAKAAQEAQIAEYAAAGITVTQDAQGNITKITKRYQATDENGQPIGHPTHLEAKSWPELSIKQQNAHENAMRLAERVKKQKLTYKQPDPHAPKVLTDDETRKLLDEAASEQDPAKKVEIQLKLAEDREARSRQREAALNETAVALKWMRKHIHDYNPNTANSQLVDGWLKENNLEYTDDNLETAFQNLQSQLAPVIRVEATVAIPVNKTPEQSTAVSVAPVASSTPTVTPAPAPAPQPVAAAPAATPAAGNQPAPARRPGVNGGIPPGSLTASRPVTSPKASELTIQDVVQLSKKNPQEFKRRIKMEPGFKEKVDAVLKSRQA